MNTVLKQRIALISSMNELVNYIIKNENSEAVIFIDLKEAFFTFGISPESRIIELLDLLQENRGLIPEFCDRFERWYDAQIIAFGNSAKSSETYTTGRLGCDREFGSYIKLIKKCKLKELEEYAMSHLETIMRDNPELYNLLTVGYRGWYFEKNWLDGVGGKNNSLIHNRMVTLKHNVEKIEWLYLNLEDNLSRQSLNAHINSWLTFSMTDSLKTSVHSTESVDISILPFYDKEVFIDCGSYIGDTVNEYINRVNDKYERIYAYDISKSTVDIMKKNLASHKNIVFNVKGVGDKAGQLNLVGFDTPFEGNRLTNDEGNYREVGKVEVVKLDDDITEPITFLKIDVEGLDKEALAGARQQIIKYHPKLHVDAYHKLVDFFEVPYIIHKIDPTYRFYFRVSNSIAKPLMFSRPGIYAL